MRPSTLGQCFPLASLLAALACGGGQTGPSSPTPTPTPTPALSNPAEISVAGTITLPTDATGRCIMVAVDTDTTGANGAARRANGTEVVSYQLVSGTTVAFSLEQIVPGTYFLWGYVDTDRSVSDPSGNCELTGSPNSGDHLGYFATGLGTPNAANVTVPHDATTRFDFQLGVFP